MARKDAAPSGSETPPAASGADLDRQLGHLERQFSLLNDQVQSLQRLASLGTMTAVVAHEINNLLTPILSYSQHALCQDSPELWRKAVERAHAGATRMQAICGGILGMAAGVKSTPTVAAIRPVIDEVVQSAGEDGAGATVDVKVDVSPELKARFDAAALRQVLINLILNARQAMAGDGGTLTIVGGRRDGTTVGLGVSDTGRGIEPYDLPRVFEPFFSTKSRGDGDGPRGIGLGLYVCKCLIESQEGTIDVESRVGTGTTVRLTLPAAPESE